LASFGVFTLHGEDGKMIGWSANFETVDWNNPGLRPVSFGNFAALQNSLHFGDPPLSRRAIEFWTRGSIIRALSQQLLWINLRALRASQKEGPK
jgi:hypothetical protein